MPKPLLYQPSQKVIAQETARLRAIRESSAHRKGGEWRPGDTAWFRDTDGQVTLATVVEGPIECYDGRVLFMVRDGDGDWEANRDQLSLSRVAPASADKVRTVLRSDRAKDTKGKNRKPVVDQTGDIKEEEMCRCGCGERVSRSSNFRPGHDARMHARVRKIKAGMLLMADLKRQIGEYALKFYQNELERS